MTLFQDKYSKNIICRLVCQGGDDLGSAVQPVCTGGVYKMCVCVSMCVPEVLVSVSNVIFQACIRFMGEILHF